MELTTTAEAVELGNRALLAIVNQGVNIPDVSLIREDIDLIKQHHEAFIADNTFDEAYGSIDFRCQLRRQVGALDVFKRIAALERSGKLGSFVRSLQHFRDAGVSLASPFTDYESLDEVGKDHTRKLYEFYVASGVALNHPFSVEIAKTKDDSQQNPDVQIDRFPIEGIACKVVISRKIVTVLDRLMEGAEQISRSACATGIVALDVRQHLDQELLMAATPDGFRTFTNEVHAQSEIDRMFHAIAENIKNSMHDGQREGYINLTKRGTFILTAQGLAIIKTEHGNVPVTMNKSLVVYPYEAPVDDNYLLPELYLAQWIASPVSIISGSSA